jgi:F0F1-type ATP synthase epsilon subunit
VKTFSLEIVGPSGVLAEEAQAESLVLPGAAGSLGVLAGHEPWTVLLDAGAVSWKSAGGDWRQVEIASGVASIEGSRTVVLADAAGK